MRRQWSLMLVLLLAATGLTVSFDLFWRADLVLYDAELPHAQAPDDIVIIAIDDRSIAALGRWPWERTLHAALLERLRAADVKGIALDLLFSEPDAANPQADEMLATALHAGAPAVLPLIVEMPADATGAVKEVLPIAPLAKGAAAVGHVDLELDRDGIARSVFLREGFGEPNRSHLMLALLGALPGRHSEVPIGVRHPSTAAIPGTWVRDYQMLIPFLGPPGHFTRYSYVDVLSGAVGASALRGKLVLVGITAQGLGDAYPTALSGYSVAMPGVEINANILQALREGTLIHRVPLVVALFLALVMIGLAFVGFLQLSPRQSLLWVLTLLLASLAGSEISLQWLHWWWPCTPVLAALIISYPLWSWRRLEATQLYLESELNRFNTERTPLIALFGGTPAPPRFAELIQHRIELLGQATERVRTLGRLLASALHTIPDAALVADLDGRIIFANAAAARLFGAADEIALEGTSLDAHVQLEQLAAAAPCTVEIRGGREARDLLVRAVPFLATAGQRLGTLLTLVDISELRAAQREREDVLRFLSHDLKSPASSLMGLASLQRDPSRAIAGDELAQRLDSLALRILDLLDGFIALAHAESADPVEFSDVDLRDAVQDASDEVWALAEAQHIDVITTLPDEPVTVRGERRLLARALANLMNNAVKYSAPQTAVQVGCGIRQCDATVAVEDQGSGISAEVEAQLFKRFARGQPPDRVTAKGAGLGLAFVRVVAEKHGGSISYRANLPHGARFELTIPLAPK